MAAFDASSITVLKGLEPVRRRPGMYIGDPANGAGLHNMLISVVERAVEEHRDGRGGPTYVQVRFDGDRVTVEDDGAGIPIDYHQSLGKSCLEAFMTQLHFGGGGDLFTWRIGLAVVNALSAQLAVEVRRGGRRYAQWYRAGEPTGPVVDVGPSAQSGTTISFIPDFSLLTRTAWDRERIGAQARDFAVLFPRLTMIVDHDAYRAPHGLVDGVRFLARNRGPASTELSATGGDASAMVDVALRWDLTESSQLVSFANHRRTRQGSHVAGLFEGLCAGLAAAEPARLRGVYPNAFQEVVERGLAGVLHVQRPGLAVHGSCRDRIEDDDVRDAVRRVVATAIIERPDVAIALLARLPG